MMSYDIFTGVLKMLDVFQDGGKPCAFRYQHHPSLDVLREKYGLAGIAGEGETFVRANRLLSWLSNHTFHKGDYDSQLVNSLDLLDYALDKGPERGINCRSLSAVLTECCLALGITARTVFLLPLSPYDCDSHVVSEVWLPEQGRWAMLDPTYGGTLTDQEGTPLSVAALRKAMGNRSEIRFVNYAYNGDTAVDFEDLKAYYAKNLFCIKAYRRQTFGGDQLPDNLFLIFAPLGYDPREATRVKMAYLVSLWGDSPGMAAWRAAALAEEYLFCPLPLLDEAPQEIENGKGKTESGKL